MNRKNNMFKKMIGITLILVLTVLTACSKESGVDNDRKRVLRIATLNGDSYYTDHIRTTYTNLFAFNNRNIELEFVSAIEQGSRWYYSPNPDEERPDPVEEMKKLMQGPNPPDLIFMDLNLMASLVDENLLTPLSPLISADDFDISDFVPAVIDGLKSIGNDEIYALAPTFSSQALIYNKAIFAEKNISPPTDNMYWDEVFDLAKLVTSGEGDDKIYGFAFNRHFYGDLYYESKYNFMAPLELSMLNESGDSMLVDSQAWNNVWTTLYDLHESKILPEPPNFDRVTFDTSFHPFQHDAFLSGKLAMTIVHYSELNEIINVNRDADFIEGFTAIDWDVVTMPVHPEAPDVGGFVNMEPIVGINQLAENRDDAWEFIKFLNGTDWAEFNSQSSTNMVSREGFIQKRDVDFNMSAFYSLLPPPLTNEMQYHNAKAAEVYWRLEDIGRQKFQQVINGDLTVQEALQQWQNEGNSLLQQVKENPDTPIYEIPVQPLPMDGINNEELEMRIEESTIDEVVEDGIIDDEIDVEVDSDQ